jgi:esterase
MELHYRSVGEGQILIILHGLFGYSDNWQTHAKKLADYYQVILIDQRNHGHSPWADEMNYDVMAEDVYRLVDKNGWEDIILVGHSMGGKTALRYAQLYPDTLEKLIVLDMGRKAYPSHHDSILAGLNAVQPEKLELRSEAEDTLVKYIDSNGVRQFLLKNLYWKEKGVLGWRMNIAVLEESMDNILGSIPDDEIFIPTLFMRGELSNYILDEDIPDLENFCPDSEFITIPKAGHWLHAEAPEEFIHALLGYCLR